MKTQIVIVFLILVLSSSVFISGCAKTEKLPDSFVIKLYSDSTSSAASRESNARLVFNNGTLVDGYASYKSDDTNGVQVFQECVIDIATMRWVNATMESNDSISIPVPFENCSDYVKMIFYQIENPDGSTTFDNYTFVPVTKTEIQKLIDDKTIILKTNETSCHYEICYELELLA
jgi:hypothetical protein